LVRTRKLQKGNVVIAWQRLPGNGGTENIVQNEFMAFAARPINALEPLVLDGGCMVWAI
jgi:hypothetical protein